MRKFKSFIALQVFVTVMLTLIYIVVFKYVDPGVFPLVFLITPAYYIFFGLIFTLTFRYYYLNKREKLHYFYLVFRTVKLITSMAFLLIYVTSQGQRVLSFTIMFFIFYLVLLVLESFFCIRVEKEINKVSDK